MEYSTDYAWNSLDIAKTLILIATPVIGGIIAFRLSKIEKKKWTSQRIIEKRLEFYDLVVPDLNDLYCYYRCFGNWKELTPIDIIQKKRKLDKSFNIYLYIFKDSEGLSDTYYSFIHYCFNTGTGGDNKGKIKMNLSKRKILPNWDSNWDNLFSWDQEDGDQDKFHELYEDLMNLIKNELDVDQSIALKKKKIIKQHEEKKNRRSSK
ncbi:hypothetical protein [Formosa sp. L2A11]|uniref:hypothetical protein n=1 Tax=Formosa sp. L2A11 TaxID=2686363 RepID=UPI00131BED98|nr:hypothetical protein [Formosa sp. L2A11]